MAAGLETSREIPVTQEAPSKETANMHQLTLPCRAHALSIIIAGLLGVPVATSLADITSSGDVSPANPKANPGANPGPDPGAGA